MEDVQDIKINNKMSSKLTGIAIADIDYFKKYNDTYGHQKGDRCLKAIAKCFLGFESCGNMQFYRYGGEEFATLFFDYYPEQVLDLTTKIRMQIESLSIEHKGSEKGKVTISIGLSMPKSTAEQEWESLLLCADKALYNAKTSGRNCIAVYNDSLGNSPFELYS